MLLDEMRAYIRKTSDTFDNELNDIIAFVRKDLTDIGVVEFDESDAKIKQLCKIKARAEFNFDNKGEWYENKYYELKRTISNQEAYTDAGQYC